MASTWRRALEVLAEPGGICVSGAVRDQVGQRLDDVAFEDLGEQCVKNIARADPRLSGPA
jgi:adenylate cyclase